MDEGGVGDSEENICLVTRADSVSAPLRLGVELCKLSLELT